MTDRDPSLFELIQPKDERVRFTALTWEGSFEDYLGILEQNPLAARNSPSPPGS